MYVVYWPVVDALDENENENSNSMSIKFEMDIKISISAHQEQITSKGRNSSQKQGTK